MPEYLKMNNGFPVVYGENDDDIVVEYKAERNAKLAETDVYMVSDFPITAEQKTAWQTYRQALRDMDFSDLDNLKWPNKPE
tara:strand:+ start:2035 stop:2277 length:243 start_codon:yes stop_codon:yes gene_type:complete